MAIHLAISKMKIGIQDMISPNSLDQVLILSTPWTRKRTKKAKKSINSRIVVSTQFDFPRKSKGVFSIAKNIEFIEEKRSNRQINDRIAINS